MYVLKFGKPFRISETIDQDLRVKYNKLHPDKKIEWEDGLACVFDDQEFIAFLKNELNNGYELQSNSSLEIFEYDETKGHPILVELTGEYDVNLFDFENGMLWSSEPGRPEYQSICKGFYYIYDKDYIDSLKTNRVSYREIEQNVSCTKSIYSLPTYTGDLTAYLGDSMISSPEVFYKLLRLAQKQLGEVNTTEIIKGFVYIEGKEKERKRAEEILLAKQKEDEIKKYCAEINPATQYISFGRSADTYNNGTIPTIKNDPYVKPTGGLWACTYSPDPFKHSDWEDYCREEKFHTEDGYLEKGFKFTLSEGARLFKINSIADFEYLLKNYGTKIMGLPTIDFEKLSEIVDGIMVTYEGQGVLDFHGVANPTSKLKIKPFCVPGITVFSKRVIENVQDFNHILENSNNRNAEHSLSATQIGTQLGEISRQGLVLECEEDLIPLTEENYLAIDEEQQEH